MTFEQLLNLVSSKNSPRICIDSRLVKSGDIFLAIKGTLYDGYDFIEKALDAGAKYIVTQKPYQTKNAKVVTVDDSATAAAVLAQASRGNPASKLKNLAVTGTNGKTTVAFLVRSVINNAGKKCGLISTICCDTGSKILSSDLTTPDCLTIAEKQQQMLEAHTEYMVTEASSHALYQNRLAAIDFEAAAFTNLTGDHLDYHKTTENYLAAKTKLFEKLLVDATAVLNKQSPFAAQIAEKTNAEILWYAVDEPADITAHTKAISIKETCFDIEYAGQKITVNSPLIGKHNISNHLAAAGLCLSVGFDLNTTAAGLSALKAIPGRLEKVNTNHDFTVLIDYAHTDDALKNVLQALKPLCKGKLILVFGCGGDRDRTKRPRMAAVAEKLADLIVVTSDNPRTEQPEYIIGEIVTGFENPIADTIIIDPDREKAIEIAIKTAQKNDIVLIAGKGHETYQIIGKQKFDFSDKIIAQNYLTKQ